MKKAKAKLYTVEDAIAAHKRLGGTLQTTKEVSYSYPFSPHACANGYGETGCYSVRVASRICPPAANRATIIKHAEFVFPDAQSAHAYADSLDLPYHHYSMKAQNK